MTLFYGLPVGLGAVLEACEKLRMPMSVLDRKALADWLLLEKARLDRQDPGTSHVTIDVRTLDAITWALAGPPDSFDHSKRTTKHFEKLLGYCVCEHCKLLPMHPGLPAQDHSTLTHKYWVTSQGRWGHVAQGWCNCFHCERLPV